MTQRVASLINLPNIGRVEKTGIIVTALLSGVSYLMGRGEFAAGVAAGGLLFALDFVAIRFIVNAMVTNKYSKAFAIFSFITKMAVFIAIIISIFMFSEINLFGFFVGITAFVIVIVGESLRGKSDGTL